MTAPIVVERRIAAPPSVVYRYFTESDLWARWQGIGADVDGDVGGIFRLSMANGMTARGQFVELVPHSRIVFTWGWVDHPGLPPGSSTVEVDLAGDDDGTVLTLTHRDLPADEIELHTAGWNHYIPRLDKAASGGDPGTDAGL